MANAWKLQEGKRSQVSLVGQKQKLLWLRSCHSESAPAYRPPDSGRERPTLKIYIHTVNLEIRVQSEICMNAGSSTNLHSADLRPYVYIYMCN